LSLFLDQKYLLLISNRLPLFTKKQDATYNCRCIICGDSAKKTKKARGYFFKNKNNLMYKCHNCDASMFFGTFLKNLDNQLYRQYSFEKYSEGQSLTNANSLVDVKFEQPQFKSSEEKILDKLLDRLDNLTDSNEAVEFCIKRKIPRSKFGELYYIKNIKDIVQLNDKYKASILTEEPRLVIPFYDEEGQLAGVTCRALRGEALRYITVKIKDNTPLIFGLQNIDRTKKVFVTEGALDSLFVDNCIAVSGTALSKSLRLGIEDNNLVMIFDNQPRNKEVCSIIDKNINEGHTVVIWPQSIEEKDINEMVLAGRDVKRIINENTFSGLTAKAKFIAWKRC